MGLRIRPIVGCALRFALVMIILVPLSAQAQPLPDTKPLTITGDIADAMVAGVDRFLLRQIEQSTARRARHWKRDLSSADAYNASVEPNRKRLAHILGVRDPRVAFKAAEHPFVYSWTDPIKADETAYRLYPIRWPVFGDVTVDGHEAVSAEEDPRARHCHPRC